MKNLRLFNLLMIGFVAFFAVSCNSDDDNDPNPPAANDSEVITTVTLTFSDTEGVIPTQSFTWTDPDGEGGNAPVVDTISVLAPVAYAVSIEVLDESDPNDVEDITAEILAEGEEHQFFFIPQDAASAVLTVTYTDEDASGRPIGLESLWGVSASTGNDAGSVRIVLRHELDKDGAGVPDGDITNAGGETDVDIVFQFVAQ